CLTLAESNANRQTNPLRYDLSKSGYDDGGSTVNPAADDLSGSGLSNPHAAQPILHVEKGGAVTSACRVSECGGCFRGCHAQHVTARCPVTPRDMHFAKTCERDPRTLIRLDNDDSTIALEAIRIE